MNWHGIHVLVTGADGFIGSHLAERLATLGARVRALVLYNSFGHAGWLDTLPADIRQRIEVFPGDVIDAERMRAAVSEVEVVFHLAALIAIPYSYSAPRSYVSTNVVGTLNVLQAAREAGVRKVVHTSTSEVYGTAQYTPIDEKHPLQGQSPYSASKIGADMMAESFYRSFAVPVAICRPFNTYGPRQSARAVIPTIVSQIAAGFDVIQLGSLSPARDLTFVGDTVEGFLRIAASDRSVGEVINLGTGRNITVGELADTIVSLMGRAVRVEEDPARVRPAQSEVWNLLCDNRKAADVVGWHPRVTLEEGLRQVIAFVQANPDRYKADVYNV